MSLQVDLPGVPPSGSSRAVLMHSESASVSDLDLPPVSFVTRLMGGMVGVHLRPVHGGARSEALARQAARSTVRRLGTWADRLTRFTTTSDLARLNDSPESRIRVSHTLAAVLDWARIAEGLSDGVVDIAWLDARLAAERCGGQPADPAVDRAWSLDRGSRETHVLRQVGLRFDLDGVAKGWLADRALGRLASFPAAVVDADGDIAIRLGPGRRWRFGVADPRFRHVDLVELDLIGSVHGGRRFGLATSGTSIHRWVHGDLAAHHLIDPRSGAPARTDVIQATVLAGTAREAEALAKTAVILGSDAALDLLGQPGADGAVLLTDRDELLMTPATMRWLA